MLPDSPEALNKIANAIGKNVLRMHRIHLGNYRGSQNKTRRHDVELMKRKLFIFQKMYFKKYLISLLNNIILFIIIISSFSNNNIIK
jgi:hypothetical protein